MNDRIARARERHYPFVAQVMAEVTRARPGRHDVLATMCAEQLATGGKRLRAVLPVLVAEALGEDPSRAYPLAAACELLHNATLVHDDVLDGDTVRRGHPTVWARHGIGQAINLGDAMYFQALLCLERLIEPADVRWALARDLADAAARVIAGQARELELKDLPRPSCADYLDLVADKTAALFALPLVGAARLVGAPAALLDTLGEAARHLGLLFQVQDDLLDLWGDKGRNAAGNDVREGKISLLVVHALARAAPDDEARLRRVLQAPRDGTGDADVAWATRLFERAGALAAALDEIRGRQQALATLPGLATCPALAELVSGLSVAFTAPIAHLAPCVGEVGL